ncbi:MAG: radical SAM protein [Bacteroidota bacterium]
MAHTVPGSSNGSDVTITDADILAARGAKADVDPFVPYAFLVEPEHAASGRVEDVATLFLTNRECPFRCLMCDLWQHTTDAPVPVGAIPAQIDHALDRLPAAQHVKLYNSGNFFDRKAVPIADHHAIAERVRGFETVIVENHPKLCGPAVARFRDLIAPARLEVALGLETIHPEVMPRLNKRMTLADYERAVRYLRTHDIDVRTFILLRPPWLSEAEGVAWAVKSVAYAFEVGVQCAAVVPVRGGNGMMERLADSGDFNPPSLASMEVVLEAGLAMRRGRVFMDLWDAEQFTTCAACAVTRIERMHRMNLTQQIEAAVPCPTCGHGLS